MIIFKLNVSNLYSDKDKQNLKKMSSLGSPKSESSKSITNSSLVNKRFKSLQNLLVIGPTLFDGKSINCELLYDVLIAVYYECQRYFFLLPFQSSL